MDRRPDEATAALPGLQARPAGVVLRDYQQRGVDEIRSLYGRGYRRVLYQGPTGSGKTILFTHIAEGVVARSKRALILGHRDEIVQQVSGALGDLGVGHGVIAAGYQEMPDAAVQIASVATLVRRLDRVRDVDLLVVDETHHAVAATWCKIIEALPDAFLLGVTATPQRLDG